MLFLEGCVQPSMSPNINVATRRVLDALGIELIAPAGAGCCGAIRLHLSKMDSGLEDVRRNIDAWWPYIEQGFEAIVMNASGCGATAKEYGHLLRDDPAYAEKAHRIALLTKDLAEIFATQEDKLRTLVAVHEKRRVVFHSPCTLQHGQRIKGVVEGLLRSLEIDVQVPSDAHLCCGSAGTYSISQPVLASQLRDNKLAALEATEPDVIISANIGCISHLASRISPLHPLLRFGTGSNCLMMCCPAFPSVGAATDLLKRCTAAKAERIAFVRKRDLAIETGANSRDITRHRRQRSE
ncbi:Cysteine-rich domain-containing protein [Burkholderia sp. D7]|nr:Cysteine-rich domain-containing protein [Burkholderia sp. D7]